MENSRDISGIQMGYYWCINGDIVRLGIYNRLWSCMGLANWIIIMQMEYEWDLDIWLYNIENKALKFMNKEHI